MYAPKYFTISAILSFEYCQIGQKLWSRERRGVEAVAVVAGASKDLSTI